MKRLLAAGLTLAICSLTASTVYMDYLGDAVSRRTNMDLPRKLESRALAGAESMPMPSFKKGAWQTVADDGTMVSVIPLRLIVIDMGQLGGSYSKPFWICLEQQRHASEDNAVHCVRIGQKTHTIDS